MITLKVTPEIKIDIENSIAQFDKLIKKEMSFSVDLRKNDKILLYTNKIIELQKAIENGIL